MFWWWWALAGYALGEEQGLREAERRIDGDSAPRGRPVVHRKQGGAPPPPPPTRSDWIRATILGILIAGTAYTLDTAFLDPLTSPGGNFTVASSTTTTDGMANFVGIIWLLMRWILYLAAFIPLSQTLQRLNESQADQGQGAKFRFGDHP